MTQPELLPENRPSVLGVRRPFTMQLRLDEPDADGFWCWHVTLRQWLERTEDHVEYIEVEW